MREADIYKELRALTKDKDRWKESIPYVSSLLTHDSVKRQDCGYVFANILPPRKQAQTKING